MQLNWRAMDVRWRKLERPAGAVALALGVFSASSTMYVQLHDSHQVSCQTNINQDFLTILKTRAGISDENTKNINGFIIAFINSKGYTPAQKELVINHYLAELAKINAELAKATYPDIPSC